MFKRGELGKTLAVLIFILLAIAIMYAIWNNVIKGFIK